MNVMKISFFAYLAQTLATYLKSRKKDSPSFLIRKAVFFLLNFISVAILLYPSFPAIPILSMLAFAVSTIALIVPRLALAIPMLLFCGYIFIISPDLGLIEFVVLLIPLGHNPGGRTDEWIFTATITPTCVILGVPYLPIFLAIVLMKESWKAATFNTILQMVFLSTFMGHYPWVPSGIQISNPFTHSVQNYSASLAHQFNIMYTYTSKGISDFFLAYLLYMVIAIVALKVITLISGKLYHPGEKETRLVSPEGAILASAVLCFILSISLTYMASGQYHILSCTGVTVLSFIPVLAAAALNRRLEDFKSGSAEAKDASKPSWDSIAGYDDIKDEIREALLPYMDPETYQRIESLNLSIVKGILLYGPTGVGKTLFAQVMAAETNMHFIPVKCTDFISKWVGESESQLKSIFSEARNNTPCIIFFDEIEAFLSARDTDSNAWMQTLVTTFLAEMDGFETLKDVLVIGATNYPNKIDPAVIRPGRFDKIIYIPHPNENARRKIFELYLKDKPTTDAIDYEDLVKNSDRYTPADICAIVTEAYRASNYSPICNADLQNLLKHNKATMTYRMLETYNEFAARFGRRKFIEQNDDESSARRLTWDSVAGMDSAKNELKRYIEMPLKNPEIYEQLRIRHSKGTLLFGPPGCGKTFLARVLADECRITFFPVKCSEILRAYTGQSESNLQDLFRKAKENRPSLIFFDELDALAEKRGSGDTKVVEQLLLELDSMEEMRNVFVLGATNRIEVIDEALLRTGRFDKLIYIGLPDSTSRRTLIGMFLEDRNHEIDVETAVRMTEGYTGAEIDYLINRAAILTAEDCIRGNFRPISMADFHEAIRTTPRGVEDNAGQAYTLSSRKAR